MTPGELVLRAHVRLVVAAIPLLDHMLSLKAMLRVLTPPIRWQPYRRLAPEAVEATVRRALRNPWHMKRRTCLREGLSLFHFLRLAGRPAVLHFAVYPPPDGAARMRGHCWVTCEGEPVSQPPDGPYAELLTCEPNGGPRLAAAELNLWRDAQHEV
jgi:hypothetical protein